MNATHPSGAQGGGGAPGAAGGAHGPAIPVWMQRVHIAGGFPTKSPDVPVTSVFLGLFFFLGIAHMKIFLQNKKRGHLFLFNITCNAFCMIRVITCALRLAWTYKVESRPMAITATIFVYAGVLLLFIINLLFSQRIMRGLHPRIGWHKGLSAFFKVLWVLLPLILAMVITATIQSFFTTNDRISSIDLDMQRAASTFFTFLTFVPIPLTLLALLLPGKKPDQFGAGTWGRKSVVLLTASVLLCLGASFRTGTAFITFKPSFRTNPPWWSAKWCFYFFQFTVEAIVVILYLVLRMDKLFHVPDGSKAPGDYTNFKYRKSHAAIIEREGSVVEKDAAGIRYGTPEMFRRDFQVELQRRNSSDSDTSTMAPSIAPSRVGEKVEVFRREVELGKMDPAEAASILDIDPRRISKFGGSESVFDMASIRQSIIGPPKSGLYKEMRVSEEVPPMPYQEDDSDVSVFTAPRPRYSAPRTPTTTRSSQTAVTRGRPRDSDFSSGVGGIHPPRHSDPTKAVTTQGRLSESSSRNAAPQGRFSDPTRAVITPGKFNDLSKTIGTPGRFSDPTRLAIAKSRLAGNVKLNAAT